ncbi:MAG: hypothetical protein ABSG51_04685 [Terracidiphilus sp.]|jgi:hypothetical protein
MRRFLTLVSLLCLAIPAGISISGCTRNPDANYCNGLGYGLQITNVQSITLTPQTGGISLAFGQTQQSSAPTAKTCKGTPANASSFTYGTTNNQLVDISPTGNICAGTWNRNTGGGINNYTICSPPDPLPSTNGLPYGIAYYTAAAQGVTSNPVQVFVHSQVTSVTLVGPQGCVSQAAAPVQLDAQACFAGSNNKQQLLCAPPSVSPASYVCTPPSGATISDCSSAIGTLSYQVGTASVASINSLTNQITAELPGTTLITASIAGSGSSAGYFTTCPPQSINVTLANGSTSGTITQGVTQDLTTTVVDTNGNPITGLSLTYQSTDPIDIAANASGGIGTNYPGVASITAICQPSICNPAPINEIGLYGTGLPVSSNPVTVTVPGTASDYLWFGAPGQSQYFSSLELLSGTPGSNIRLPYVPNSMIMDQLGTNIYFGSVHELMFYSTFSNTLSKQDNTVPGVVLAASPNGSQLLINDRIRQVFYLYNVSGGIASTFGGMGTAAAWTPDSQTLYIADSASTGPGHTDTLYVYNYNTGWTTTSLAASGTMNPGATSLAVTVPSIGAYLSGNPTVAHTWCPAGTVGNYAGMQFYPQGDSVNTPTDVLASTTDGQHIFGAAVFGGGATLSDIAITIPTNTPTGGSPSPTPCPDSANGVLSPLTIMHTLNTLPLSKVNATAVNQVVPAPASDLAFVTYTGSTPGALLPYYIPGSNSAAGTVNYVTLNGASAITAPLAGAFSPDGTYFFVSTAGDNQVHFISIPNKITTSTPPTDSQQIAPSLPACTPGADPDCILTNSTAPASGVVPATVVVVKPRSTT